MHEIALSRKFFISPIEPHSVFGYECYHHYSEPNQNVNSVADPDINQSLDRRKAPSIIVNKYWEIKFSPYVSYKDGRATMTRLSRRETLLFVHLGLRERKTLNGMAAGEEKILRICDIFPG